MAENEQQPVIATFLPEQDVPLAGTDALAALERALEAFPDQIDVVVEAAAPQPIGRSWDFSFADRRFIRAPGARGPQETRGAQTLANWIEKCLNTARGAHPVHPEGYGLIASTSDTIGQQAGMVPADLFERIREALVFHPRISDVSDFDTDFDPDDDYLLISFVVHTDNGESLPVTNLALGMVL